MPPRPWQRHVDTTHHFTVEDDGSARLDALVARHLDLSRTQAATLIAAGRVQVNAAAERSSFRPVRGDTVVVEVPPAAGA